MFKSFGKYSVIIITTVLFLSLVITVLGLNFYMSFQVEANAESVNVAGRQRMLSQRISKSLLNAQALLNSENLTDNRSITIPLKELKNSTNMFNTTLNAFERSGEIVGTNGELTALAAVTTEQGQQIIDKANSLWRPFHKDILITINALETADHDALVLLAKNTKYARENINSLLALMNDLTNEQENIANTAATQSRLIQAFGIVAALLCFIVIMYRIFGQLRVADAQAERAQRETQQIFSTVDQGLFLLNKKLIMGAQHSQELEKIFSDSNIQERGFTHFLKNVVSSSDMDNIKRYMKLLFDPHKKQKLIADLNPLNEVAIQVKNGNEIENKSVRFNFMRVYNGKEIDRVLTSVSDITKEVQLAKDLERESKRSEQQLEMVSAMMAADKTLMPLYLENCERSLNRVNELLRAPSRTTQDFKDKALSMMAAIHKVKGESAALSLHNISDLCHEFETNLSHINEKQNVDGHDFVELTVLLNKLMSYNMTLNKLFTSVFGSDDKPRAVSNVIEWDHLTSYANEVAKRQNKRVDLQLSGLNAPNLSPELVSTINTISTQFIRNAISHGIETSDERQSANKSDTGIIYIALFNTSNGDYEYMFHDNGSGIDFEKIAQKAVEKCIITSEKAKSMSKAQLINLIFSIDLSTSDITDQDQGRGVGMSAILDAVKQLGGRVSVKTNPVIGTTFTIQFPKELGQKNKIAA